MAFHNVRLPDSVERGAQGGPQFKTQILTMSSGYEKRNIEWSKSRGEWDIGFGIRNENDLAVLTAFFYARLGRAHTFRYKDWTDFKMVDSLIGTGNGTNRVFQAIKNYTSGGFTYQRKITKLAGAQTIKVNGVVQPSGFTIDLNTGVVTFDVGNAPPNGHAVTLTSEFDCHVRFDTDKLDVTAEQFEAGLIPNISVIEIKE